MPLDVDGRHVSGISGVTFRITADSRTDRILAPITGGGRRATRSRACGRSSSEWLSYDLWVDDPTSLAAGIRHSARGSRGARKGRATLRGSQSPRAEPAQLLLGSAALTARVKAISPELRTASLESSTRDVVHASAVFGRWLHGSDAGVTSFALRRGSGRGRPVGSSHVGGIAVYWPLALPYLQTRFAGQPPPRAPARLAVASVQTNRLRVRPQLRHVPAIHRLRLLFLAHVRPVRCYV